MAASSRADSQSRFKVGAVPQSVGEVLDLVDNRRQRQRPSELRRAQAKALAEDQSSRSLQTT